MNVVARWGVAVGVSAAAFAVSWWACQARAGLDEGAALGVAGAVLAVVLAVAAWWAAREQPDGPGAGDRAGQDPQVRQDRQVRQDAEAGRNAYVAARDVVIYNRGAQIADRYTRAIEQLGSSTIDVTIAGIYALEQIALDSEKDHQTVIEVLSAYIREHSREQRLRSAEAPVPGLPKRMARPHIQAAVT
jgi:hypothetical protein